MDLINNISRWAGYKKADMQHVFDQWAQGSPMTEQAALMSAKRLTHAQAGGGVSVMSVLKLFPISMTLSSFRSDKNPNMVLHGQDSTTHDMGYPVVGPPCKQDTQSERVGPISQMEHKQPKIAAVLPQEDSMWNKLQYVNPKTTHSRSSKPSHLSPELSKSSLWKHICAPPFTPSTMKSKYAYDGMITSQSAHIPNFSNIDPYSKQTLPETANVPMWGEMAPPIGWHNGSYVCGQVASPYYKGCGRNYSHQIRSVCTTNSSKPSFLFSFGKQPLQVYAQPPQYVFAPKFQTFLPPAAHQKKSSYSANYQTQIDSLPCTAPQQSFSNGTSSVYPTSAVHTANQLTSDSQASFTDNICQVAQNLESMHIASRPGNADATTVIAARVTSPQISVPQEKDSIRDACTTMAHNCDKTIKVDSVQDKQQHDVLARGSLASNTNRTKRKQEDLLPQTVHVLRKKSSSTEISGCCQNPYFTPTLNSRKKRKSRPSAEKRRRRRMAGITATHSGNLNPKKLLQTGQCNVCVKHMPTLVNYDVKPEMSMSVAFIQGAQTDNVIDDAKDGKSDEVHISTIRTLCLSISSCDSDDSDFDNLSCDGDVVVNALDETTWSQLNILDPFNPLKFQQLNSIPQKLAMSVSTLESAQYADASQSEEEMEQSTARNRNNSFGKHVQFAAADCLVTVHVIEGDLDAYREARQGPWEVFARDRDRFRKRVEEVGDAIGHVFAHAHRQLVLERRAEAPPGEQEASQ